MSKAEVDVPAKGGFSFGLCRRNEMLMKKGLKPSSFLKTGTTIVGLVYKIETGDEDDESESSDSESNNTSMLYGKLLATAAAQLLATAAAQLKVFNCVDHKKIQRFSGHPGSVRCMIFSEDGKYIISSAVTERYVAVWRIDGSKKKSSCCVLAMDHPAAFLDSRCTFTGDTDDEGLCVLAISEMGVCNFWYGENIDELRDSKPTKIFVSPTDGVLNNKGAVPTIFAAKLQVIAKPACLQN